MCGIVTRVAMCYSAFANLSRENDAVRRYDDCATGLACEGAEAIEVGHVLRVEKTAPSLAARIIGAFGHQQRAELGRVRVAGSQQGAGELAGGRQGRVSHGGSVVRGMGHMDMGGMGVAEG